MSRREVEGQRPLKGGNAGNVVPLQPAGNARGRAPAGGEAPALKPVADAVTRDGLDLLKAFFAIDDAAARAALILLAQQLAQLSGKR
jgi:hypothetical protein